MVEQSPETKNGYNIPLILGMVIVFIVVTYLISSLFVNVISSSKNIKKLETSQSQTTTQPTTTAPTTAPTTEPTLAPTTAPTIAPVPDGTFAPTPEPTLGAVNTYCGPGTIQGSGEYSGQCIYFAENGSQDLELIVDNLKNVNKILPIDTNNNLTVISENIADLPKRTKEKPDWFKYWEDKGRYDAPNLISYVNIWGEGVNCDCGDCAGWRGGNAGSCTGRNSIGRGKNSQRRVACDDNYDPSRCVCAYPYTPIGGLCVSPFKYDPDNDPIAKRPCCPSCVYDGTCIGKESCLGKCEENLVEYPGIKYNCSSLPELTGESYSITQSEFDSNCTEDKGAHGQNEYKCALECSQTSTSQLNCSKKCLPKLWRWDKLLVDGTERGFIQSDKLVQFESSEFSTEYCPVGDLTCQTIDNVEEDNIQNCFGCTDCKWELNPVINEYVHNCSNCDTCEISKPTGIDSDGFRTFDKVSCKNVGDCKGCSEVFDPLKSNQNVVGCNYCKIGNCLTNNKDPVNPINNGELKLYNEGENYDPKKVSVWEDFFSFGDAGTAFGCSLYTKNSSCSTSSGGMNDGGALGFSGVFNEQCTERGKCSVPSVHNKHTSKQTCYGGKYYDQLNDDVECQKLPLPVSNIVPGEVDYTQIVKNGVAKGLSEDECKEYFCKVWDWSSSEWVSSTLNECNAICEPDLFTEFDSVPEFATTEEQIKYLFDSGPIDYCFSGRNEKEVSGNCKGITKLPSPSSGATSNICETHESRLLSDECDIKNCPIYAGGITNACERSGRKATDIDTGTFPQKITCVSGACKCKEGTCPQSGLCLKQEDNNLVKYGIAKGLPEWQCPHYYCQVYDREKEKWVESNSAEAKKACAAMCLPEVYKGYNSIPSTVKTTKDQVDYLTKSGFRQEDPYPESCDGSTSSCVIL